MITADLFKRTMRQLASGVVVVTVAVEDRLHAMTATAFVPLSLNPPLVLVCIDRNTLTHFMLSSVNRYGINVLAEDQAPLSVRFSRSMPERYRFNDLRCFEGPHGVTFLRDCAAYIEVEREQAVPGGDHTIFIGRILWAQANAGVAPLVHYQGAYHGLARMEETQWTAEGENR